MKWQPLQRGMMPAPSERDVRIVMRHLPMMTYSGALAYLERELQGTEHWLNDLYQVEVRRFAEYTHLNIRRRDGKAIFRDWRHFQAIKNQLVGPENEGIELYPAESRLVDTSNKYHLYVMNDPTFRWPFGFRHRDVVKTNGNAVKDAAGYQQRPRE